jgi:hypothetical protein
MSIRGSSQIETGYGLGMTLPQGVTPFSSIRCGPRYREGSVVWVKMTGSESIGNARRWMKSGSAVE